MKTDAIHVKPLLVYALDACVAKAPPGYWVSVNGWPLPDLPRALVAGDELSMVPAESGPDRLAAKILFGWIGEVLS